MHPSSGIPSYFLQGKIQTLWHHRKAIFQTDPAVIQLCVSLPMLIPLFSCPFLFSFVKSHISHVPATLIILAFCWRYLNSSSSMFMASVHNFITAFINLYGNDLFTCFFLHCECHEKKNCYLSEPRSQLTVWHRVETQLIILL